MDNNELFSEIIDCNDKLIDVWVFSAYEFRRMSFLIVMNYDGTIWSQEVHYNPLKSTKARVAEVNQ